MGFLNLYLHLNPYVYHHILLFIYSSFADLQTFHYIICKAQVDIGKFTNDCNHYGKPEFKLKKLCWWNSNHTLGESYHFSIIDVKKTKFENWVVKMSFWVHVILIIVVVPLCLFAS